MTKREAFETIKTLVADNEELVEFVDKELALLDKRNSANEKAKAEKAKANAVFAENIISVLEGADKPMSTMEIGVAVGISPQKATPLLKSLVKEGKVAVTVDKRKNLYSVAEVDEDTAEVDEDTAE